MQNTALTLRPKCPFPVHANTCVAGLLGEMLLMKMSDLSILFLQLWSLWHKNAAPKAVRQTVLLLGCAAGGEEVSWENEVVSRVGK